MSDPTSKPVFTCDKCNSKFICTLPEGYLNTGVLCHQCAPDCYCRNTNCGQRVGSNEAIYRHAIGMEISECRECALKSELSILREEIARLLRYYL